MNYDHMSILIVDDNPINLKVLSTSLKGLGCTLVLADDGDDALARLDDFTPSLILLDIMMPVMDGFDLYGFIRERDELKDIPIIFITALSEPENESRALSLGAVDFISKPFNPEIVKLRVENSLKLVKYTELLKQEKEQQKNRFLSYVSSIINSMPICLIGLDKNLYVNRWNDKIIDISGVSEENAIGRYIVDLLPHFKLELDLIKDSRDNRIVRKSQKRLRITSQGTKYENVTIFPVDNDEKDSVVVLIEDITDQVELQNMVIQSERAKTIGNLAAGISYEIMNPLAGIIQNSQSLISRFGESVPGNIDIATKYNINLNDLHEYLEERHIFEMLNSIKTSGIAASHVIKTLTSFSKSDYSNMVYSPIDSLITQSMDLAKKRFRAENSNSFKNIIIKESVEKNIPNILCEPIKIVQVLLNMFLFAERNIYMVNNKKDREIVITTTIEDNAVRVSVEDNGLLWDVKKLETLKHPYFSGKIEKINEDNSLSLSKFIIEDLHHGKFLIDVNSRGRNIVSIFLPLK